MALFLELDDGRQLAKTAAQARTDLGLPATNRLVRGAAFVNPTGLTLPVNPVPVTLRARGVIQGVTVLTQGGPGSCVIDIWRDSYDNYPPSAVDSICSTNKPTINNGLKYSDDILAGWSKHYHADDVFVFNLEFVNNFTLVAIYLTLETTP